MTSYIIYPNFEWECENSQLEIFERVLESNYSKAISTFDNMTVWYSPELLIK